MLFIEITSQLVDASRNDTITLLLHLLFPPPYQRDTEKHASRETLESIPPWNLCMEYSKLANSLHQCEKACAI